jgi:hydrogenase maturation protease
VSTVAKVLVFAYGNPSRGDDALGPLLGERIEVKAFADVEILTDFQLQVEHAMDLCDRDLVLFADASLSCEHPYTLQILEPERDHSYTTHSMSPGAVLEVYRHIYEKAPPASFLLSMRGESFELGQGLSEIAQGRLSLAVGLVERLCGNPRLEYWLQEAADSSQEF